MRYIEACEHDEWHLHLWHPLDPANTQKRVPFRCRSWRHAGDCCRWKGAQDFVRVREAIQKFGDWTYLVLTFAQADWPDEWSQYKAGVHLWAKLRKRLVRRFGTMKYVQTWERFKKGGCHVNVLVHSLPLFAEVQKGADAFKACWLERHAVESGFGWRTWAENMAGGGVEMAGYLTKLSRELVGAGVKDQVPRNAPPHFRRLRASARTLPPIRKTDFTGLIRFCNLERFLSGNLGGKTHDTESRNARHPEYASGNRRGESSRSGKRPSRSPGKCRV